MATQTTSSRIAGDARSPSLLQAMTGLAGVCVILGAIGSSVTEWAWILMLMAFAALAYALPQLHRLQAPGDGLAGKVGAPLAAFGGAVIVLLSVIYAVWEAVGEPGEPAWSGVAWVVGFFSFLIGIVLFAVGTMMADRFPRGAGALMLLSLVAAVGIDMATGAFFDDSGDSTEWGLYIGLPLFGVSLLWIAASLGDRAARKPHPAQP